jgi:hypothetical protein
MTLGELIRTLDWLLVEGVSEDVPVSVDLTAFDVRRKHPDWGVLEVQGILVEAIDMCDAEGKALLTDEGQTVVQHNVILK